jgi:hypothetical protein
MEECVRKLFLGLALILGALLGVVAVATGPPGASTQRPVFAAFDTGLPEHMALAADTPSYANLGAVSLYDPRTNQLGELRLPVVGTLTSSGVAYQHPGKVRGQTPGTLLADSSYDGKIMSDTDLRCNWLKPLRL